MSFWSILAIQSNRERHPVADRKADRPADEEADDPPQEVEA